MANLRKITDVPTVADATGLKFIVNDNGEAKQIDGENIIAKTETPDWTVNDETSPSFIKNKPTKLSQFTNDIYQPTKLSQLTNDMYGYREEIFSLTLDDFVLTSVEFEEGQFQDVLLFKAPKLTWLNAETLHFLEYEFYKNVSLPGKEDALVNSFNSREDPLPNSAENMYGFEAFALCNGINPITQEPMDELWIITFYDPDTTINSLSMEFRRRHENISNENINVDMFFIFGDEKPIFGSYEKVLSMLKNASYPNIPKIIGATYENTQPIYRTPSVVGIVPDVDPENSDEEILTIYIEFPTSSLGGYNTYVWYPDNSIYEYVIPPS